MHKRLKYLQNLSYKVDLAIFKVFLSAERKRSF